MSETDRKRTATGTETTDTAIGQHGRLVLARCTGGCGTTTEKRAKVDEDGKQSFKHVCHECKKSTHWNVLEYRDDGDDDQLDRGDGPRTDGGSEIDETCHANGCTEPAVTWVTWCGVDLAVCSGHDSAYRDEQDDDAQLDRGDGPRTDGGEDVKHTHYCEDCDLELAVLYDDREDESTPLVCGHCGGTNTRRIIATDGGRTTAGDLDADRTVYHAGRTTGQDTMIHLSRDCRLLTQGKRDYSDRAGDLFDDRPVCSQCTGERDHGGLEAGENASATRERLADMDPEDAGLSPTGERAAVKDGGSL